MNGNVEEWVWDWYEARFFVGQSKKEQVVNPMGSNKTRYKVVRGGHFRDEQVNIHTSARSASQPRNKYDTIGFRLCRSTDDR